MYKSVRSTFQYYVIQVQVIVRGDALAGSNVNRKKQDLFSNYNERKFGAKVRL